MQRFKKLTLVHPLSETPSCFLPPDKRKQRKKSWDAGHRRLTQLRGQEEDERGWWGQESKAGLENSCLPQTKGAGQMRPRVKWPWVAPALSESGAELVAGPWSPSRIKHAVLNSREKVVQVRTCMYSILQSYNQNSKYWSNDAFLNWEDRTGESSVCVGRQGTRTNSSASIVASP